MEINFIHHVNPIVHIPHDAHVEEEKIPEVKSSLKKEAAAVSTHSLKGARFVVKDPTVVAPDNYIIEITDDKGRVVATFPKELQVESYSHQTSAPNVTGSVLSASL